MRTCLLLLGSEEIEENSGGYDGVLARLSEKFHATAMIFILSQGPGAERGKKSPNSLRPKFERLPPSMIMARKKTNPVKATKEPGSVNSGSIPPFDEYALSVLTAKIESGFNAGKPQRREANRGQNGGNRPTIQAPTETQSKTTPTALVRSTKRDVRGNAKLSVKDVGTSGEPSSRQTNGKGDDGRAVLLNEILALGGTEEDLDLVADAVSDEEDIDSSGPPDKSFRKDLANFVAGLGFEGGLDEGDYSGSEDEDISDGWEDASDLNTSAASDGGADAESVPAAPLRNLPSDEPKRLVSSFSAEATGPTDAP